MQYVLQAIIVPLVLGGERFLFNTALPSSMSQACYAVGTELASSDERRASRLCTVEMSTLRTCSEYIW